MIITVDGLSGVGKGTVARLLAEHYGFVFMDTGLLFRRVAYLLLQQGGDPSKEADVLKAAEDLDTTTNIPLAHFRTEEISQTASKISTHPALRQALLRVKRTFALKEGNAVFDGRDMGTVVFPEAEKKIFLIASPEIRAERRLKDLENQGIKGDLEEILKGIKERDLRDSTRSVAPTKPALDAFVLDTSHLSIQEVFKECVSFIEK
jgi:cytidylate kinase